LVLFLSICKVIEPYCKAPCESLELKSEKLMVDGSTKYEYDLRKLKSSVFKFCFEWQNAVLSNVRVECDGPYSIFTDYKSNYTLKQEGSSVVVEGSYSVLKSPPNITYSEHRCELFGKNITEPVRSCSATIPYTFKKLQRDTTVEKEGREVKHHCEILSGYPVQNVSWSKLGSEEWTPNSDVVFSSEVWPNDTIILKKPLLSDSGVYACHVGDQQRRFKLIFRDRLSWIYPFVGIIVELIILGLVIGIFGRQRPPPKPAEEVKEEGEDSNSEMNRNVHGTVKVRGARPSESEIDYALSPPQLTVPSPHQKSANIFPRSKHANGEIEENKTPSGSAHSVQRLTPASAAATPASMAATPAAVAATPASVGATPAAVAATPARATPTAPVTLSAPTTPAPVPTSPAPAAKVVRKPKKKGKKKRQAAAAAAAAAGGAPGSSAPAKV
jgi:hypothetical protein